MIRKREKKENLLEKRKKENNKKKRPGLTEHHLAIFKVDAQGAVEAAQSEQSSTLQYDDNLALINNISTLFPWLNLSGHIFYLTSDEEIMKLISGQHDFKHFPRFF